MGLKNQPQKLIFAGKTPANLEEIKKRIRGKFGVLEIFVTEEDYENGFENVLIGAKEKLGVEFYSIHTPHVEENLFPHYLELTENVAKRLGIKKIVVHSGKIDCMFKDEILNLVKPHMPRNRSKNHSNRSNGLPEMVIENDFDDTPEILKDAIKKGFSVCLDTAHLYIASHRLQFDYHESIYDLLRNYRGGIGHIHLNDAKRETDNLPLGEGETDYKKVLDTLEKFYSGVVVIETPGKTQAEDLKKVLSYKSP